MVLLSVSVGTYFEGDAVTWQNRSVRMTPSAQKLITAKFPHVAISRAVVLFSARFFPEGKVISR